MCCASFIILYYDQQMHNYFTSYHHTPTIFYVLLTVHLSIFISVFNQLDAQNLFHNKFYFMPLHVSSTCVQFWPRDDEHMCSKHVEAWNKTYCETNFVHQVG